MFLGLAAACGSGSKNAAPPLAVVPSATGFELSWGAGGSVQIQVSSQAPLDQGWDKATPWEEVPTGDDTGGKVSFDDVVPQHRYRFRIRTGNDEWSDPVERLYVQTTLPVVRIDTDDGAAILDDERTYRDGTFALDPGPDGASDPVSDSEARTRGRGNSTWDLVESKKSYQVDLSSPTSLLGMPAAKKWVLLANYFDPSQLRHFAAMQVAAATDLGWEPAFDWVEVYFNDDYAGVYILSEKIDTGPDKVDIAKLTPEVTGGEEITGGYLLQIEMRAKEDKQVWETPRKVQIAVQRPKKKNSNDAQFSYIRDYVNDFEDALFSKDFTDPSKGYRPYLDVRSFIDYWIVQEVTFKTDAYQDSAYFSKQRGDPKLHFGPVWDFDASFGSQYSIDEPPEMRWITTTPRPGSIPGQWELHDRPWVIRIFEDPWFQQQVSQRWAELAPAFEKIPAEILAEAPRLEVANANDMVRWKDSIDLSPREARYGDQTDWNTPEYLADWLNERIEWMTEHIDEAHAGSPTAPTG